MKTNSGFDLLAPIYDSLARFVFGKSIVDSQTWYLDKIPDDSRVLILGGGTGWLLEELQKRNSSCTVCYIEISKKMIERARSRELKSTVHFIQGTEEDIPASQKFDVVITNFYLDLFSEKTLKEVVDRINSHTTASTLWIVTDFVNGGKWWHKLMLKTMYLFFNVTCRIDANHLSDWADQLRLLGWCESYTRVWHRDFIKSTIWKRT